MVWKLFLIRFARISLCVLLLVTAANVLYVCSIYFREQRIARTIESIGGHVEFLENRSNWIPSLFGERLWICDRVKRIEISCAVIPSSVIRDLGQLSRVTDIIIDNSPVTDSDLKHLKSETSLVSLFLVNTKVTDAGLEHLKNLHRLEFLYLDGKQITADGRSKLRNALPFCKFSPELPPAH